jgi:hypothetical protein
MAVDLASKFCGPSLRPHDVTGSRYLSSMHCRLVSQVISGVRRSSTVLVSIRISRRKDFFTELFTHDRSSFVGSKIVG